MVEIIDFSDYKQEYLRTYGGASGRKYDINYKGEKWFLKFPGNIKEQVADLSYSNSAISEYIGSQIYSLIGIDVHDTLLGIYKNKCVVACRDFVGADEFPVTGFGELKTTFVPAFLDSQGNETNGNGTDLQEILQTLEEHPVLQRLPEIKARFWDMFIIDALIGNNDRNNGNWGLIRNFYGKYRISPVFDNGGAFLPKTSEDKMERILKDPHMLKNVAFSGCFCIFTLEGHKINPLKYIMETENRDCAQAVERIIPRINMAEIGALISEIPEEYQGVEIISAAAKNLYQKMLEIRYYDVLVPTFQKIQAAKEREYDLNAPGKQGTVPDPWESGRETVQLPITPRERGPRL